MTKTGSILLCALAVTLVPISANAQEQLVNSAGGALAGVLVAGPIGAVAGGVIGLAAGPGYRPRHGAEGPPASSPCPSCELARTE